MAFRDPNAPFVAKRILTALSGQHIDINGPDTPNGIGFYTGDAAETFPGVIQPFADADLLSITESSPLVAGHTGSSLNLQTGKGINHDSAQLGTQDLLLAGSSSSQMTGPLNPAATTIHFLLDNDGSGVRADVDAPRIFLRDTAVANDNGLIAQGTLIQPISARWFTTADTALTGTWVDTAGARFGYYKDSSGIVHLRGLIRNGAAVAMVTLPAGFRPSSNLDFTLQNKTTGGITSVGVSTAGLVQISTNFVANTMQVYLDVVTFPTL